MKSRGLPSRLSYERLFEPWELELAERLVRRFCGRGKVFPESEFETLLADVLTDWYFERAQYDAVRFNSPEVFMKAVVERDLTDRARAEKTFKRKFLRKAVSLNEPIDDDGGSLIHEGVIPDTHDPLSRGEMDLRYDLDSVRRRLNSRQGLILTLLLEGRPVTEIATVLKTSRSTVHDEIARVRNLFESQGLRDYLKWSPTLWPVISHIKSRGSYGDAREEDVEGEDDEDEECSSL